MAIHLAALNPWAMFALGLVPMIVLWAVIGRVVRRRGLPWPVLNIGMPIGLSSFQQVIREERDPTRKGEYRVLGIAFCACFGWCVFWLVRAAATQATL